MFEENLLAIIPEGKKGDAEIQHFSMSKEASKTSALREMIQGGMGGYSYACREGDYIKLLINGRLMMSNTRMEKNSNHEIVSRANGDVLIAGLGVGLIVIPICRKKDVRTVTVIENNQNVIDLVEPYLRKIPEVAEKLKVIKADIFEFQPNGQKWDTLYFDIWQDICEDNLEEIAKLHNKYKFKVNRDNPNFFMDSWMKETLKGERRRNKRRYPFW
tara:strand:- start:1982 stop:2629 length:648 start_codon:yes stop_codon:yes gene_type:complete